MSHEVIWHDQVTDDQGFESQSHFLSLFTSNMHRDETQTLGGNLVLDFEPSNVN